jgi:ribosomal protein S26
MKKKEVQEWGTRVRRESTIKRNKSQKDNEKNTLYEITEIHVFYSFHVTQTGVTLQYFRIFQE